MKKRCESRWCIYYTTRLRKVKTEDLQMQAHSFTEEEQELANQILQQIGEQVIGEDPLVDPGDDWPGTVAHSQSERSEPLTYDKLLEARELMVSMMPPLVTDIWFVDRSCQYWEFMRRHLAGKGTFAPATDGLWLIDGIRLRDYWSGEDVPGAPAWCNHPGIWVEYNNGDCWRLEDVAKMGPRGWFARQQWEYDSWRQRATGFLLAVSERLDQWTLRYQSRGMLERAVQVGQTLLALHVDFGPRPAGALPSFCDELNARQTREVIKILGRIFATAEWLEGIFHAGWR